MLAQGWCVLIRSMADTDLFLFDLVYQGNILGHSGRYQPVIEHGGYCPNIRKLPAKCGIFSFFPPFNMGSRKRA
jgi:hypothetical protein